MAFSSWLCTNSTKNTLLKIVHPGGHMELHDRPVQAAEIMQRNPRCCVAHPNVFKQPWAIVAPDTMLPLGQKFYVVPISTIRKLQRLSSKYSPSPVRETQINSQSSKDEEEEEENWMISSCCSFTNKKDERENSNIGRKRNPKEMEKDHNCFMCFNITGNNYKINAANGEDSSKETRSSSICSLGSCDQTKMLNRKRVSKDVIRKGIAGDSAPKRFTTFDHWQPNLDSITEE